MRTGIKPKIFGVVAPKSLFFPPKRSTLLEMAMMTSPSVARLVLMAWVSRSRWPQAWDLSKRSLPARSTRLSTAVCGGGI